MVRGFAACVAVGLAVGLAHGQSPAPVLSGDLVAAQGYWKPQVSKYEDKDQMPENVRPRVTLVFDRHECYLYFRDKVVVNDKPQEKAVLLAVSAVEMTAHPNGARTIDFTFVDGALKGQKRHGIYELTGDTLKLCYGPTDKPRPASFTSPAGSGYFNEVWAREKKSGP